MRMRLIGGEEIDTTDDGDVIIDRENLAMVAIVGRITGVGFQRIERMEFEHGDAGRAKRIEHIGRRVDRAEAVIKDRDRNPGALLCGQQIDQLDTVALDILEGEVFEIDVVLGRFHRGEHRPERRRSIAQQLRAIANRQRRARDFLFDGEMLLQQIGMGIELGEDRLALRRRKRATRADHGLRTGRRAIDDVIDRGNGTTSRHAANTHGDTKMAQPAPAVGSAIRSCACLVSRVKLNAASRLNWGYGTVELGDFVARTLVAAMPAPQLHGSLVAMTLPQALSFAVLGGLLILFIWDRLRFDIVALLALMAAVACGIVPMNKAFSGFSNSLLPLIASALVISNAVGKSGLIEQVVRVMRPLLQRPALQVGALSGAVAALSAIVKNIGALAIFLPIATQVARRNKRAVGEFLMPMSFASLAGGMMTLIGTSPNIIASSLRQELLGKPYRMFDFFPVGVGITLIAIAFLSFGWRLLPIRSQNQGSDEEPFKVEDYLSEVRIPEKAGLVGKTVGDFEAVGEGSVGVTAVIREGRRRYAPASHWRLEANDILMVESNPQDLQSLVHTAGLELVGPEDPKTDASGTADTVVVEAVVTSESFMVGASFIGLRLRERYGVNLVAVSRGVRRPTTRLAQTPFSVGDVVALQGPAESMSDTLTALGCLPLAERNLQLGRPRKLVITGLILLACVVLSATEIVPPELAFTGGAVLTVIFGILTLREAYEAIDWPILVLLGALIPVGEAVRSTGTTDLIAGWISTTSASLPIAATLAILLVITMLLTPLVHHAAAVIVMGPVAVAIAKHLGVSGDTFLIAVAVGASCDFLSPIGHQCNTLVMGPGGYRFGDYWHLGLPLSILVVACGTPLILLAWPLH